MLLAIDVGNTQIVFGAFSGNTLQANWRLASDMQRTSDEYALLITMALARYSLTCEDITSVILASVTPHLLAILQMALAHVALPRPLIVGPGIKTRLKIRFESPAELGGDRIANSVAAHYLYGEGSVIVVDFGTATVFDVISTEGEYLGGVLTPGIRLAADALAAKASRVPHIELAIPPRVVCRTTTQALQAGLLYGHADLLDGILRRIKTEIGEAKVIATGDEAARFMAMSKQVDKLEPHLTLQGLRLLHEFNIQ